MLHFVGKKIFLLFEWKLKIIMFCISKMHIFSFVKALAIYGGVYEGGKKEKDLDKTTS